MGEVLGWKKGTAFSIPSRFLKPKVSCDILTFDMDHLELLIRIVSGLFRIFADAPKAWENVRKGWNCFAKFLQTLGGPVKVDTDGGLTLSGQVSTAVSRGRGATGSASCSATLS